MNFNPKTMVYCKSCNQPIAKKAKVCPNCGAKNKKPLLKKPLFWIIVVIVLLIIGAGASNSDSEDTESKATGEKSTSSSVKESSSDKSKDKKQSVFEKGLKKYKTGEYKFITNDDLNKYYPNLKGEKIYIVAPIDDIDSEKIQINVSDGYMMSSFETPEIDYSKQLKEDETIAILCEVGSDSNSNFLGSSFAFKNAFVFAKGDKAKKYKKSESDSSLKKYFTVNEDVAENVGADDLSESEFISLCKEYSYEEILRNPDSYKDKPCKLSGTVDQIIEGILNTYTIFIESSSGDKWECSYIYKDGENHLLEGDSVTIYGILDGTTTAETVLGKQVTMPSVSIEYIK